MLVRGAPEQSTYQCRGRDLLGGGLTPQPSIEIFGNAGSSLATLGRLGLATLGRLGLDV